mmetsp:Transcript_27984/g.62292  ORF Transcript_27984/g.62292 Transcript_27984/m.62292 type:complete len:581 (+) Transcript_27984:46-1788(+)
MSNRSKRKSRGGSNANAGTPGSSGGGGGSVYKKGRSAATRIDFAASAADDSGDDGNDDRYDDDLYSDDESSGQEMSGGGRMRKGGAGIGSDDDEESSDEEERETVDAKKIRLARQYLDKMERRVAGGGGSAGDMGDDSDSDDDGESSSDEELSDDYDGDGGGRGGAMAMGPSPSPHDKLGAALARQRRKQEGTLERRLAAKTRRSISCLWEGRSSSGPIADFQSFVKDGVVTLHRGHDLTPTAVALHRPSGSTAYSGSKDNSVCMWDVERGVRTATLCPQFKKQQKQNQMSSSGSTHGNKAGTGKKTTQHRADGEVLALAASDDGRYLAAGHRDATVKIYDVRMAGKTTSSGGGAVATVSTTFRGHKGPVTSLCFRQGTLQLFTASEDRCLRHYNLEEMAYVETMYGHQAAVSAVSCARRERPISVGRDRTVRSWKLAEETHLIYRPGGRVSSADCVCAANDNWFLSGHEDGNLSLWSVDKKRPVGTVQLAHGLTDRTSLPRGITAVDVLPSSDVAVTGSFDGYARFWNVRTGDGEERGLESIGRVPLHGYVNDLALGPRARFLVAAGGQEPRLEVDGTE